MLFVNFKDYKIVKDFKFSTRAYGDFTQITTESAAIQLKKTLHDIFSILIKPDALAINYELYLPGGGEADEEDSGFFLGFVNIACAEFFRIMIKDIERKTEYRLDVPEKLKGLHVSYSLLKKACNYELVNDVFNLTIKYKNLTFSLCDQDAKSFEDVKDFKHTTDELENKHE